MEERYDADISFCFYLMIRILRDILNHKKRKKSFTYYYANASRYVTLAIISMNFSNTYLHAFLSVSEWHSPLA
jgi:Na+/pantothenate symporter